MSDQAYRSASAPAPVVDTQAQGTSSRRSSARDAGGGGNAYAASMAPKAEDLPDDPGFFDKLGTLTGSTHMRNLLGKNGAGVVWDDKEKGANKPNVDVWGKDRIRIPKLRISSVDREGIHARNLHADGIELNEREKAKDGKFVGELAVPTVSATDIESAAPPVKASGIDLANIKVRREYTGSELTEFFSKPGTTSVEVGTARITGFAGAGAQAQTVVASGLTGSTDGTEHRVGAASVHADGLSANGASAASADLKGFNASLGAQGTQVGATSLTAADVSAAGAHFVTVGTHGLSAKVGAGGVSASADKVEVGGASGPNGFAIQSGSASGATFAQDAAGTRLGARSVNTQGVAAGGASAQRVDLDNASVALAGGAVTTKADAVSAAGVSAGGAGTVEALNATNASFSTKDGVSRADAASLDAAGVDVAGMHLDAAKASGLGVDLAPNQAKIGIGSVEGTGFSGGGARAARLGATGVTVDTGGGTPGAPLSIAAKELSAADLGAGGAHVDQITATDAAATLGAESRSATLGSARASGITAGNASIKEASLSGGTYAGRVDGVGGHTVGAAEVDVGGVAAGDVSAARGSATNAKVTLNGGAIDASAQGASADGLRVGQVGVGSVNAGNVRAHHDDKGTNVSAGSLGAKAIDTGNVQVADATLTGAGLAVGADGARVDVKHLKGSGIVAGSTKIASVTGDDAGASIGNGATDLRLGAGSAKGVQVGNDVRADAVNVSAARLRSGNGATSGSAGKLGATGVRVGDNRVGSLSATDAKVQQGAQGLTGSAATVDAAAIKTSAGTAESASARNLAVARSQANGTTRTTATAGRLGAKGVVAGNAKIGAATASDVVALSEGRTGSTLDASGSASATGVSYVDGAARTSADAINLGQVKHHQAGGHSTTTSSGLTAQGVRHTQTAAAGAGTGRSSGAARGGSARGSGGPSLADQAVNLVGSADLQASVPLTAQTMNEGTKRVTVKPGTTAYVEVQVRGGKVVPANTKASFSTPLDTWAWTSVPGLYMNREGKLYASVDGLWDIDLTETVTGAMGQKSATMPLRVADLARSATGGSGGTGGGRSGSPSGGSASPAPADLSELKLQGTVGLNAGTVRGDGMSATLGSAPGANVAQVQKDGDRSLSVAFSKLLLDAFGVEAGGAKVDVKNVQAQNASARQEGSRTSVGVGSVSTGQTTITR